MVQTLRWWAGLVGLSSIAAGQDVTQEKISQLNAANKNTQGQVDTSQNGVEGNTTDSLRAGPRGYNLLEDISVRKKVFHFDRERQPERVVHALGTGAFGQFESYGDWSNITMACWLQSSAVSEVFTRFSVVISSTGGSQNQRDTHGFATKIYSKCGNQDLVGNHLPSFFIDDGASFPDLIHSVKAEQNTGFPTDGSAHNTAYDYFNFHPEGAMQLMSVLSDLGIPRDVRHISGNGIHTYRFLNAQGKSTLFKWYWKPMLGHRALIYPEAQTLAGLNNDFVRQDLYNNIAAGNFPEWELMVQMFPDDGTYMYKGYDLLIPTQIVPFEVLQPVKLGKLTLNRNYENFFSEPENIAMSPGNVVDGVSFVPDPLLQWRLVSYDDTASHRHGSPNFETLPINRPIAPVNNNYRDGYMQPYIYQGESASTPNDLGGVVEPGANATLMYTSPGETAGTGPIGRYTSMYDWFGQARVFWNSMNKYGQQDTVNAYRFELGHCSNADVVQRYIQDTLNNIDNCLARRVAWGIGATMPAIGSSWSMSSMNSSLYGPNISYPSLYPLNPRYEPNKSLVGLSVALIANDTVGSTSDVQALMSVLAPQKVMLTVVAPYVGTLSSGVTSNASFITTNDVFYDAVFVGSMSGSNNSVVGTNSSAIALDMNSMNFVMGAYGDQKPIGVINSQAVATGLGIAGSPGVYVGSASMVVQQVAKALAGPVKFPQRFPIDDIAMICGAGST